MLFDVEIAVVLADANDATPFAYLVRSTKVTVIPPIGGAIIVTQGRVRGPQTVRDVIVDPEGPTTLIVGHPVLLAISEERRADPAIRATLEERMLAQGWERVDWVSPPQKDVVTSDSAVLVVRIIDTQQNVHAVFHRKESFVLLPTVGDVIHGRMVLSVEADMGDERETHCTLESHLIPRAQKALAAAIERFTNDGWTQVRTDVTKAVVTREIVEPNVDLPILLTKTVDITELPQSGQFVRTGSNSVEAHLRGGHAHTVTQTKPGWCACTLNRIGALDEAEQKRLVEEMLEDGWELKV